MHDGETTRSATARRLVDGLRKMPSPKVSVGLLRALAIGSGAFVSSRRWLFAALLITGLLLALMSLARPNPHVPFKSSGDADVKFDDVKTFPLAPKSAGSGVGLVAGDRSSGRSSDGSVWEDGSKPGEPMALSRRLDAVRSRQARGAWLTGAIDPIADSPPGRPEPGASSPHDDGLKETIRQTPDRVLR